MKNMLYSFYPFNGIFNDDVDFTYLIGCTAGYLNRSNTARHLR